MKMPDKVEKFKRSPPLRYSSQFSPVDILSVKSSHVKESPWLFKEYISESIMGTQWGDNFGVDDILDSDNFGDFDDFKDRKFMKRVVLLGQEQLVCNFPLHQKWKQCSLPNMISNYCKTS